MKTIIIILSIAFFSFTMRTHINDLNLPSIDSKTINTQAYSNPEIEFMSNDFIDVNQSLEELNDKTDFFAGRKTNTATKEYTYPNATKQYILILNSDIDESFETILTSNDASTIISNKFIKDNSIILNIGKDGDYSLDINNGHIINIKVENGTLTETITTKTINEEESVSTDAHIEIEEAVVDLEKLEKDYIQYALNYRDVHANEEIVYHSTVNERTRITLSNVDVVKTDPTGEQVLDTWSSPHSTRWTINKGKTRMFYQEKNTSGDFVDTWSAKILSYMYDDSTINLLVKKNGETFTVLILKDGSKVVVAYDSKILIIK